MRRRRAFGRGETRDIRVVARPAYANAKINPYNSLLYGSIAASSGVTVLEHRYTMLPWGFDIFHVHWPEHDLLISSGRPLHIIRVAVTWVWLSLARLAGVKIVWTAHNESPHDMKRSGLNSLLWNAFLSVLDGVIFLSEKSRSDSSLVPQTGRISALIKHGDYRRWVDSTRRANLEVNATVKDALEKIDKSFVILSFGQIRPYKNIDSLIRQFSLIDDRALRLVIAGGVHSKGADYFEQIAALAKLDPRIALLPFHLDDPSLLALLERADLVVLPYRKVLNSGSAFAALSAGKHLLVPSIGSMVALQKDVGGGAVTIFDGELDARVLLKTIELVRSNDIAAPDLSEYDNDVLASKLVECYRQILSKN